MSTLNERVEEALTRHDVEIIRYEAGLVKDAVGDLSMLQAEIVRELKGAEPKTRRQLDNLLSRLNVAIDTTYAAFAASHVKALTSFAMVEQNAVAGIVSKTTRVPLLPKKFGQGLALEIVETSRSPNTSQGATVAERWARQGQGLKTNISDGLGYAVDNDKTLDDMLRIVRGNRALQFRDGVVFKSKKGAETVIRTAQATTTNATRQALYERNSDTVAGQQAVAVLDNRTTILCRSRNGYAWRMNGRPFRGTPMSFPGSPPWHWNCRTSLMPIFNSLEDLQSVVDPQLNAELEAFGDRFPIDGKPAPTPSFAKTFNTLSEKEQRQILGRGRLELYQDKKITLNDLLNQQGRELTLTELKNKYGD